MDRKRTEEERPSRDQLTRRVLKIILRVLIVVAVLLVVLLVILKYDQLTPEALHDVLTVRDEAAPEYSEVLGFASNSLNAYAVYGDGLAVLSPSGLELQDGAGEQTLAVSKSFSRPVLSTAGDNLAAFDVGGTSFLLVTGGKERLNFTYPSAIIAADVAPDGKYAVAAEESGVRGAVAVYSPDGDALYKYFSAERFIVGCALNDSSEKLAIAGVRQEDAHIISGVILMSVTSETPFATWETEDELVLSVEFLSGDRVLVLTETRAVFLDKDGDYLNEYLFGSAGITGYAEGDDFIVLCPETDLAADSSRVAVLAADGSEIGDMAVAGLVGVSAYGNEFGILTNDAVLVYNRKLERVAQRNLVNSCRSILLKDGAVFALSSDYAEVYTYR